jgi:putative restriction endonuclease
MMRWKQAVIEALRRYSRRHPSRIIHLHSLISEEMEQLRADTGTGGKTPDATLRRELQELREAGLVEFIDDNGTYRYLGDV